MTNRRRERSYQTDGAVQGVRFRLDQSQDIFRESYKTSCSVVGPGQGSKHPLNRVGRKGQVTPWDDLSVKILSSWTGWGH